VVVEGGGGGESVGGCGFSGAREYSGGGRKRRRKSGSESHVSPFRGGRLIWFGLETRYAENKSLFFFPFFSQYFTLNFWIRWGLSLSNAMQMHAQLNLDFLILILIF